MSSSPCIFSRPAAGVPASALRTRPHASRQAFTLLELMVVILLIGILTAAIVPEMHGTFQDALLRSSSRELVNVFSLASSRAVSQNQLHRVRLDEKNGRYVLERRVGTLGNEDQFAAVDDVPGGEGNLDSRITVVFHRPGETASTSGAADTEPPPLDLAANQLNAISFYPDGTADGGEIELHDNEGFRFVLHLNPVTARVRVVELARK